MLLSNCRYVVTQNEKRQVLEHVDILLVGNRIAEIGKGLAKSHQKVIDCRERIVMPGLVNCHTHLPMSDMRGYSDDEELDAWLKKIVAAEHKRSRKEIAAAAALGIREALRTGTTTICDMYWPSDVSPEVAEKLGIRLVNFPAFFSAHETLGEIKLTKTDGLITTGIGPHSIYGTDEKFLRHARDYATKHNMLLQMHLAETRKERVECKERTGFLPVNYLDHLGFLGPDVMLAHAVWLTKGELDVLAKHDVKIVHCPQSNMKLAGGSVMPLREMQERGITVALGTDSTASNNSLDMFREMHVCALLHKHHYWDPSAADAQTVLDMGTVNGAKVTGLNIGSIEVGKLADIITLDATAVNLQPLAKERIVSHLVYAANGFNVAEVIVDGKLVLEETNIL